MKAVLITSSILIVMIAVLRPLLRGRVDPRVQYALWLAVVLRLLVPVNFVDSAYSALALLGRGSEPARIVEAVGQTSIPVQSYDSARAEVLEEYRRQGVEEAALTPGDLMAIDSQARELMRGPTLAELAAKYARPVWLGGAAVAAAWFLLVNLRLRRRLRDAQPVEADCPLPVYVSGALSSPCLCGTARPAVYVTPAALENPDRLRHVLAHELTHYRHRDHWWALARCLCLCVYWFDPLVWWAAALSRQDCELACDEGAIRRLGEWERLSYGRTLVDMIAAGRTPLLQTATTMAGGKRRVRERIQLIARKPKTVIAAALALTVVLALAVGCTFTGAPEASAGPGETQRPENTRNSGDALSAEDLQQRLLDVPEELRADVVSSTVDAAIDGGVAVGYTMNRPEWAELDPGLGWLVNVTQISQGEFQDHIGRDNSGWECFARSGDTYFVLSFATDVRWYAPEDEEPFRKAFDAIRAYAERQVLNTEGVEPFDPADVEGIVRTINAVMDEIACAPGTSMVLYQPGGAESVSLNIDTPPDDYWSQRLVYFSSQFGWEKLTQEQAAALMEQGSGVSLMLAPSGSASSACVTVYEGLPLVAVRTVDNEMKWYQAKSLYGEEPPLGAFIMNPGAFEFLRDWFDQTELDNLRITTVPDRGQSRDEVVREWIDGNEGALTKCTPGSEFACTYVRGQDIDTSWLSWMTEEELDAFAQSYGLAGADFGRTWFAFGYNLVFVAENENARNYLIAGNTVDYTGNDAPEGAQMFMRVGIMRLVDGKWTCTETGTGL
jgi:beta-lactamase regulating signal transducer with metallopeptidase domain